MRQVIFVAQSMASWAGQFYTQGVDCSSTVEAQRQTAKSLHCGEKTIPALYACQSSLVCLCVLTHFDEPFDVCESDLCSAL